MSLKLSIVLNSSSTLEWEYEKNCGSEVTATLKTGDSTSDDFILSLVELSFNKQMYRPGEIDARVQIYKSKSSQGDDKSFFMLTVKQLNDNFRNRQATLTYGDYTIAECYYVYKLTPHYTSESLYVDFKLHSPDQQLAEGNTCHTFVAKRLFNDIATGNLPKLPYNTSTTISYTIAPQNKLKSDSNEYIQPYLVQFNESFYDMLVRTANRWGEFVYFENGKLVLGCETGDAKSVDSYDSISYFNCNEDVLATENFRNTATRDDYLAEIEKGKYIKAAGDYNAKDSRYSHHVFQGFLHMKSNVFDWVTNQMVDDRITAGQNKRYLKKKEDEYNSTYFSDSNIKDKSSQYGESDSKYRQFATFDHNGGLTSEKYETVLEKELKASQEMICVDLGVNYQDLCLGDVFSFSDDSTSSKYIVVQVECTMDKEKAIDHDSDGNYFLVEQKQWHFRVYAVKQVENGIFYPPMLPTGHVRFSGPQKATIVDTFDPKMNGRYRVVSSWQTVKDNNGDYCKSEASPWLCVAHEMMSDNSGSVWQLEKGTEVLLDFQYGNVELPYIVGALQNDNNKASRHTLFNNMDLCTPAGHAIRLTDGYGGGLQNFLASGFFPLWGLGQGFCPWFAGRYKDWKVSKYYEGGMELTDHFGIYSIKASTDKRNITINSPYGDVVLNAFTGITISAPNGDVKIQGKNISIEAGNTISIESGKNIKEEIVGGRGWTAGIAQADGNEVAGILDAGVKAIAGKVLSYLDIPFIRYGLETVIRPVAGTMGIHSNRFMTVTAGIQQYDFRSESILGDLLKKGDDKKANNQNVQNNNKYSWHDGKIDPWLKSANPIYKYVRDGWWFRFTPDETWGANTGLKVGNIKIEDINCNTNNNNGNNSSIY